MLRLQWACKRTAKRMALDHKEVLRDVLNDINLRVWRAIQKYRFKPYKQVLMLAYRSGQNAIVSIRRAPVRSLRKGANQKQVFDSEETISSIGSQQLQSIATVILLDTLVSMAIKLVGEKQAPYLIKASLHEWMPRKMTQEKQIILNRLKCEKPRQVKQLVRRLASETKQHIAGSHDNFSAATIKTFGMWRQKDLTYVH